MIRLSERLEKIAVCINKGDRVADIGTDHGYIPIFLKQAGVSNYVVASDINSGPLEKMKDNMEKHLGADRSGIDMRLGSGLETVDNGEVDSAIIAGMGGMLMIDILKADMEKTRSLKRLVLQPRNAQDKLRKWLLNNEFRIVDELLARESRFIWEIIVAEPFTKGVTCLNSGDTPDSEYFLSECRQYEVGQVLIKNRDPLLGEFIEKKLAVQREIAENSSKSTSADALICRKNAIDMIQMMEGILEYVGK